MLLAAFDHAQSCFFVSSSADSFGPLGTDLSFLEVGCCRMVNVDYVLEFDVP